MKSVQKKLNLQPLGQSHGRLDRPEPLTQAQTNHRADVT